MVGAGRAAYHAGQRRAAAIGPSGLPRALSPLP